MIAFTATDEDRINISPKAVILGLTIINIPRMIPSNKPSPSVVMDNQKESDRLEFKEFNIMNNCVLCELTGKENIRNKQPQLTICTDAVAYRAPRRRPTTTRSSPQQQNVMAATDTAAYAVSRGVACASGGRQAAAGWKGPGGREPIDVGCVSDLAGRAAGGF